METYGSYKFEDVLDERMAVILLMVEYINLEAEIKKPKK